MCHWCFHRQVPTRQRQDERDEKLLERVKQRGAETMKKGSPITGGQQEKVRRTTRLRKVWRLGEMEGKRGRWRGNSCSSWCAREEKQGGEARGNEHWLVLSEDISALLPVFNVSWMVVDFCQFVHWPLLKWSSCTAAEDPTASSPTLSPFKPD